MTVLDLLIALSPSHKPQLSNPAELCKTSSFHYRTYSEKLCKYNSWLRGKNFPSSRASSAIEPNSSAVHSRRKTVFNLAIADALARQKTASVSTGLMPMLQRAEYTSARISDEERASINIVSCNRDEAIWAVDRTGAAAADFLFLRPLEALKAGPAACAQHLDI